MPLIEQREKKATSQKQTKEEEAKKQLSEAALERKKILREREKEAKEAAELETAVKASLVESVKLLTNAISQSAERQQQTSEAFQALVQHIINEKK